MSQSNGGTNAKASEDEPGTASGAFDRDSEGVYYISVEDFERRIVPKDAPADGVPKRADKGDGG